MSLLCRSLVQRNAVILRQVGQQSCPLRAQFFSKTVSKVTERTTLLRQNALKNIITKRLLSSTHDHSKLWVIEKAVSVGLLAVIPAALLCQSSVLDYLLALSLVAHCHWGFEAIVIDYIRPSIMGPVIPKIALGGMYLISFVALAGLFYLNYSDVGLSTSIKMIAKA